MSFNPSTGLSVFQTPHTALPPPPPAGFNPSTGLSVFQTAFSRSQMGYDAVFQSLDWVERLSDFLIAAGIIAIVVFQSLDWVERLSD